MAMKNKEIREKSGEEIQKLIQEKRLELSQLRFDVRARQTKNHQLLKGLRKELGQLLTELKKRANQPVKSEIK